MDTKKSLYFFTISLVLISFMSLAWAATDGQKITLDPMKKHKGASGTAVISSNSLNIEASGLKPSSVYTVWFVNKKPKKEEIGAGTPPYMFKTNASGDGSYAAPLEESPFGKWQMIMIVLHPNGDPKDMKKMVGALKAKF